MLLNIIEGVTHINPKVLKALAITSNVLLVIGIIIMLKAHVSYCIFVVSLTISLVILMLCSDTRNLCLVLYSDDCYRNSLFCIILKF